MDPKPGRKPGLAFLAIGTTSIGAIHHIERYQVVIRAAAHVVIRFYQLTFSALVGRQCRHLPSCSDFTDEAIQRYGFWAGGWMGAARICRCHPWGTSGFDPIPEAKPSGARWFKPWRYGRWGWNSASDTR